ncbi:MAG: protein phosphatase 2C domain-containing protein [Bacteroidales bacterium]|jgi:serine/threonine protein phosphatase PrpC|nr:protein phosphatase 2C domain-containing protein [Bacteroidales bacterium]
MEENKEQEIQKEVSAEETPQAEKGETTDSQSENSQQPEEPKMPEITYQTLAILMKNLPNGKVKKEYEAEFDVATLKTEKGNSIASAEFEGLQAVGLDYFPEEKKIKGIPTAAGDHKITIRYKLGDWTDGKPVLLYTFTLIINPDPRVLWNNTPTPETIEYYKPDSDKAFVQAGDKNMAAASQRGRSHAHEGNSRDDDFALHFDTKTDWYALVVADGAGSAKFSREGARIACQTAKEICEAQLSKDGIAEVLDLAIAEYHKDDSDKNRIELYQSLHSEVLAKAAWSAFENIVKEAQAKVEPVKQKEYATTLILSIAKKFEFGWFVGAWWVGDGGIGIYQKENNQVEILGEPDGGEFAGQTRFLTMGEEIFKDRQRTYFKIVKDFTALVLMTDGITDPKFETDANLKRIEKWNALWEDLNGANEDGVKVDFTDDNAQAADQLLRWLDFWSKGNHDDRTIAILY